MQIYVFDRSNSPVWRNAAREDVRFCKFVGWLPEKKSDDGILAIGKVMMNHDAIRDSFLRFYNTDNSESLGNPNAAGFIKHYKIVGWHSLFLDLSTLGDKMSPIREAITQLK